MAATNAGGSGLTSAFAQPQAPIKIISSSPQKQVSMTPEMPAAEITTSGKLSATENSM